jgi:nitroimidazol reductase NimA-like FMN-containing flavoprotein (pyridoxamine 5'-phosphate oxidase superfamily)
MRRSDRELSEMKDIEEIISNSDVCRIALANDNIPYIVTMNFGYISSPEKALYFHCAPAGKKLDMIRRNNYVCFEMDTDHQITKGEKGCDWGMKFSSVIGSGKIFIVEDKEEKKLGMNCILEQYGGSAPFNYDERVFNSTTILRLEIAEITGKRKK